MVNIKKQGKYLEVNKYCINCKKIVSKMDFLTFKEKKKKQNYF